MSLTRTSTWTGTASRAAATTANSTSRASVYFTIGFTLPPYPQGAAAPVGGTPRWPDAENRRRAGPVAPRPVPGECGRRGRPRDPAPARGPELAPAAPRRVHARHRRPGSPDLVPGGGLVAAARWRDQRPVGRVPPW